MKRVQSIVVIFTTIFFSGNILAGVYKCTDHQGNTSYQSAPCAKENKALEINMKTGGSRDLSIEQEQKQKQNKLEVELKEQQEAEEQRLLGQEVKRKKQATEQSALNQQLIRNNPIQFSAFAIPPYSDDNLPDLGKQYEIRLPEIEKFRRLAAQKALATGECNRVEAVNLSSKSKADQLVFSVACSSAKTFYFNETELAAE